MKKCIMRRCNEKIEMDRGVRGGGGGKGWYVRPNRYTCTAKNG